MHLLASQLREHPQQSCPPLKLLGIVVTQPGILQPPRVGGVGGGCQQEASNCGLRAQWGCTSRSWMMESGPTMVKGGQLQEHGNGGQGGGLEGEESTRALPLMS